MRRRLLIIITSVFVVGALATGSLAGYTWWKLATIETFEEKIIKEVSQTNPADLIKLPEKSATFLLFSVGSEGIESGDGDRLGIGRSRAKMADGLTDSIMVMIADPSSKKIGVISVPRDTWLEKRGHRVNESYNRYGVNGLISDITELTGLPIDHAVSVNFAAFADITDALGGVEIELAQPVRDLKAKLELPAGCVQLDGAKALAFVRSRHWQIYSNGTWRSDATSSDWGRIERQQSFLRLILARILTPELPVRIPALVDVAGKNLTIDADLTVGKMLSWAKAFAGGVSEIAAATIPGRGFTTDGGASVIGVDPVAVRATVERLLSQIETPVLLNKINDGKIEEEPGYQSPSSPADISPTPETSRDLGNLMLEPDETGQPIIEGNSPLKQMNLTSAFFKQINKKPQTTTLEAQTIEQTEKKLPKPKASPWSPDNGQGLGGLRFTACS